MREAIDALARRRASRSSTSTCPSSTSSTRRWARSCCARRGTCTATLYERERDGYGPGTRALLELGAQVTDAEYERALDDKERVAAAFADVLADVDVLAGPTVAYPAPAEDPPVGTPEGDLEGRFTAPYNLAGTPAVSVPCGIAEGTLPAGLQLAAAVGNDAFLLSVARAYEEVRR